MSTNIDKYKKIDSLNAYLLNEEHNARKFILFFRVLLYCKIFTS